MNRKQTEAQQLQKNQLLREIFVEREADLIAAWRSSDTREGREALFMELRTLDNLREILDARVAEFATEQVGDAGDGPGNPGTFGG